MKRLIALVLFLAAASPALADDERLDALFAALAQPDEIGWEGIEDAIWEEWSQTGSPTLDYLLERGREAMDAGDTEAAIEHFSALLENAPDFAEGYNDRATAYFDAGLLGPALADIGRTLVLEPRHFGAMAGLGLILEDTGNLEGALEVYEAARAIHPHRPDLREAVQRLEAELQGTAI